MMFAKYQLSVRSRYLQSEADGPKCVEADHNTVLKCAQLSRVQ